MTEITYTNKDGLTPAEGTTSLDWTNRNGVTDAPFDYHKDAASGAHGYAHGGYPEITGEASDYTNTSYKTGDNPDFFDNGNIYEEVSPLTVESIAITKEPTKTEYTEGDALDLTGLEVTATMSGDGEKEVVTGYTAEPASGASLATTDTSVLITYASQAASFAITVTASSASAASSANTENQGGGD